MDNTTSNTRLILSVFHLGLGVLLLFGVVSKVYSLLVVAFGVLYIIKNNNDNNQAALWAAYMVGAEVLFRMAGGMIFYELPKYAVLVFLLVGLLVENRNHHISVSYLIYILLLLLGIVFVDIPFNESIRKAIAFNLSGPVLLGVSAIYFYKRKMTIPDLLNLLFMMGLPILSMLSYLYFKTPDLEEITFGSLSNFETSGGYGPNQVATILGVGVFIFTVHLFFKTYFFELFVLDVFMLMYMFFRGLITLSRGGMIAAFLAISVFTFYYILSKENKIRNLLKYAGLVSLFGIAIIVYTSEVTGGMLINRYTNRNSLGIKRADVSAGRVELFKSELEGFFEHPFFGIGVGGSKYYRQDKLEVTAASHNEMSRLLGEHGVIGLLILIMLVVVPLKHIKNQPYLARGFLFSFLIFWFLTINHSAMRIAFPGFIYGLSVLSITFDELKEDAFNKNKRYY